MKQEIKVITISDDYTLETQLQELLDLNYNIVSMAVVQSGGYSQYTQHADKVIVVVNKK